MRYIITKLLLAAAALFVLVPASASAQSLYNPRLPSPEQRYPVCATQIDPNKPRICTANPDLPHNRLSCKNDRCPEDWNVYPVLQAAALDRACEGSCVGGFFTLPYMSYDGRCIYRIVPDGYVDIDPEVRQFDRTVSELANTTTRSLATPQMGGRFQSLQRNYRKQVKEQYMTVDREGMIMPAYDQKCRW